MLKRDPRLPDFVREVYTKDGLLAARVYGTTAGRTVDVVMEAAAGIAKAHGYTLGKIVPEVDGSFTLTEGGAERGS